MQINKAINNVITNALANTDFKDVEVNPSDLKDSIPRPSLRVAFNNTKTGKFNSQLKERNLTVRLYFYAKDRYKYRLDNLKMQEIIENTFLEDIKVTDTFYLPITSEDGVESDVVDTVLQCSFDVYSLENIYDDSALENIEDLNLKLKLEE